MKKTLLLAMMAAVLGFTACSKEEPIQNDVNQIDTPRKGMVLHATVAQPEDTKATFTDNEGIWHFDYAENDQITVTNKQISTYYTFTYNGTDFISTDAEPTSVATRWYAYYPSNKISFVNQTGKWEDLANVYAMVGYTPYGSDVTGEDGLEITMEPKCAILKIVNQKGNIDINVMHNVYWVNGLTSSLVSLVPTLAESKQSLLSTTENGTYYIAVPAGIALTVKDGDKTIKSTSKGLKEGKYYEIDVIPEGALPGLFTVNDNGNRVYFSWGDLWRDSNGLFHFEDNQYDLHSGDYNTSHISHFMWSKDADVACALQYDDPSASDTDVLFTNATQTTPNPNFTVNGQKGTWRTLSKDEWKYLIENNGSVWATINGIHGRIIFCDGYSGSRTGLTAIPDGCVFLPGSSYRHGGRGDTYIGNTSTIGYYWSASPEDDKYTFDVVFGSDFVFLDYSDPRFYACAVRLVTDGSPIPKFTVTFDMNGKTGMAPDAIYVSYHGAITKPTDPAVDGYTFWGWYKDAACTVKWDFAKDVVTSDITLYAKWQVSGALPGTFTVDDSGKKVYFSKGNLWANASDSNNPVFYFESNQYDVPPLTSNNETESHVGHFYWSKSAAAAISLSNYTDADASREDVFFTNDSNDQTQPNPGFTVNGQTGFWRVLSGGANGEWKYLINYNDECGTTVRSGKYKYGVTVCGLVNCLILLPDDWEWDENTVGTGWQDGGYPETSTDKVTWQTMETAGAVCLPAAGDRDGDPDGQDPAGVGGVGGSGYYWSASPYGSLGACGLSFSSGGVFPDHGGDRGRAYAVRLVTESK